MPLLIHNGLVPSYALIMWLGLLVCVLFAMRLLPFLSCDERAAINHVDSAAGGGSFCCSSAGACFRAKGRGSSRSWLPSRRCCVARAGESDSCNFRPMRPAVAGAAAV